LLYVDPPWTLSLLRNYENRVGKINHDSFGEFLTKFVKLCKQVPNAPYFVEMGISQVDSLCDAFIGAGVIIANVWDVTYYRTRPAKLVQAHLPHIAPIDTIDLTGIDDSKLPVVLLEHLKPSIVMDFMCGKGIVAKACLDVGATFYGAELNRERLQVTAEILNASIIHNAAKTS